MVKDLSAFIGEGELSRSSQNCLKAIAKENLVLLSGLASCLPRIGMDIERLDAFMNRPETAPAHEAMDALRVAREQAEANNSSKTFKESNFDDILGTVTRETSPLEGPSRKRLHQDSLSDVEMSKRARAGERRQPPATSHLNEYPESRSESLRGPGPQGHPQDRMERMQEAGNSGRSNDYTGGTTGHEETPPAGPANGQSFMLPQGRAQEAMQLIGYHLAK
jgi:hypothetical protein